jgi:predicted NBD/HSP70 family sugar kinase
MAMARPISPAAEKQPLGPRERQFASLIWRNGPQSRRELQQLTGIHPTLTGNSIAVLIKAGLLREGEIPPQSTRGRPQIPVELDPEGSVFLGLSISPGTLRLARLDPTGRLRGPERVRTVGGSTSVVDAARAALDQHLDESVHSIGVSFTGLMEPASRKMLFSSSQPSTSAFSLQPIYDAARRLPVILHNDMHAAAMRWLLTSNAPAGDVLLVGLDDGRLGASILIEGQPQRGSLSAANELGHMRLAVETDECYCGMRGCLERIISTPQLARFGMKTRRSLDEALADPGRDRAAVDRVLQFLAIGLSNAVNFIRPQKLVIASPLARHPVICDFIRKNLNNMILPGLRERVETIFWQQPTMQSAENAAWLALADVFAHSFQLQEPDRNVK